MNNSRWYLVSVLSLGLYFCVGALTTVAAQQNGRAGQSEEKIKKEQKLQQIVDRMNRTEPSIEEVRKAALRFHGLEQKDVRSNRQRAAWKGALPKLGLEFQRNSLDTEIDKFNYIAFPEQQAGLEDIGGRIDKITASATWNLPELAFNPEVLEVLSVQQYRAKLLKEVVRTYFLRRRLKIGYHLNPPEKPYQRHALKMRVDELTATLNGLTGGVFEKHDEKNRE